MGWGGKYSVLDVHIEYAYRHPASFPVGLVVQCWADRRAYMKIDSKGNVEVKQ
ncbi:MAG: fumarate hydratase [Thermoplasmata archaeon]